MKYHHRLLAAASAAFFFASSALAQNAGTVTNHAFAIGKGAGTTGYTSLLCTSAQLAVGQAAADPICRTITGDVTITAAGVTAIGATKVTSAMLNADVFSTAHTWAGQQSFVAPILGTPASGTLTNATGLPISTGVSGLGAGCATFLGTPSSANLRGCLTDEVGTGAAYFVGGALGTPASATLTNATGLPLAGLAAQGAYTFVGNNTGSSALPTAVDIAALTTKASPAAGDYVILSDQAAAGAWKKAAVSALASAGSVASVNGSAGTIITDISALQNCSLAVSASASALTIALKDAAGSDPSAGSPCAINFRNATGTVGTYSTLSVTAANSLVVSSGSTLGVTSSRAFRLWVVAFNDAGTFRLGVVNCATSSGVLSLTEDIPANSTAEGGAGTADSAGVIYTGTAVTSKAYRILGYIEWNSTGLTAGTWTTTNLASVQAFGAGIRKPGSVVQELQYQTTSTVQSSSTSYVDSTLITAQITPRSAANRVRLSFIGYVGAASATNVSITQYRNINAANCTGASAITPGSATAMGYARPADSSSMLAVTWVQLDSPNTTQQTTYCVFWKDNLGTQHDLGRRDADATFIMPTVQYVTEIMG